MEILLSRLSAQDVTKLKELNKLFGVVFKDSQNYSDHKPSDTYLRNFLKDENNIVITATKDGQVAGGLVAYCLTKFERERKEVYLYDLAVTEDMQRQGIGKKLIDELRDTAKSVGAYIVFVQADEGDDAVSFYESLQPSESIKTRSFDFDTN